MTRAVLNERETMLSRVLSSATTISVDCISGGPNAIESNVDEVLAEKYILQSAIKAEEEGYDAFVIYCFSDAGLEACRELISIPVIGPGYSSFAVAVTLGTRIGVLTTKEDNVERTRRRLKKTIFGSALCSVRSVGLNVPSLRDNEDTTKSALLAACKKCSEADNADAIILGCLGMANYGNEISEELGIPILDPAFIAVTAAEIMAKLHLRHSKNKLPVIKDSSISLISE